MAARSSASERARASAWARLSAAQDAWYAASSLLERVRATGDLAAERVRLLAGEAEDGEQAGSLLLGVPGADGVVTAGWVDSWHQKEPTLLSGTGSASSASVGYEYAPGWRWEVEVRVSGPSVELAMRNVVPESDDTPAVTYDVMRASWS